VEVHLTHIGGPTVLIEVRDWRLLTDPTFDPPGGSYRFGWGTGSRKLTGPALPAADLGPIDAVPLSHDHHEDNLDPAGRTAAPVRSGSLAPRHEARWGGGGRCSAASTRRYLRLTWRLAVVECDREPLVPVIVSV
jgi:L-ascorbate metabolism protein UlaG (beta-lactamase superfamily)